LKINKNETILSLISKHSANIYTIGPRGNAAANKLINPRSIKPSA